MKRELPLRHLSLKTIGIDIHTILDVCFEILQEFLLAGGGCNLEPLALNVVKTRFLQVFRSLDVIISDLIHEVLVLFHQTTLCCRCVQTRKILHKSLVEIHVSELGHVLPALPIAVAKGLLIARFTMERAFEALRPKCSHGDCPFAVML